MAVQVYNHDIAGLLRRMNRFIEELLKSVSSSLHQMNAFDQTRLQQYLDALRNYHAWVIAQPQLDLPETSPRLIEVPEHIQIVPTDNESIADVMNLFDIAWKELASSQSARMSSGMVSYDTARFLALISKMEAFLTTYIQAVTPLDLPESSPLQPVTGPGRTGV